LHGSRIKHCNFSPLAEINHIKNANSMRQWPQIQQQQRTDSGVMVLDGFQTTSLPPSPSFAGKRMYMGQDMGGSSEAAVLRPLKTS